MFFNLINNKNIKDRAYDYMFSLCDSISCLNTNYTREFNESLIDFKNIKKAIKTVQEGESWGMFGQIYTLDLSLEIKDYLKKYSIYSYINTSEMVLENITLLKNKKVLYSICTHEGYEHFDDNFKKQVESFCLKEIETTNIYIELNNKISNILNQPLSEVSKELTILKDIYAYINEDWQAIIYVAPKTKQSYEDYFKIAKRYLSDDLIEKLNYHYSFKSIHSENHARNTPKEFLIKKTQDLYENEICKQIFEELSIISAIYFKTFGIKI